MEKVVEAVKPLVSPDVRLCRKCATPVAVMATTSKAARAWCPTHWPAETRRRKAEAK